MAGGLAMVLAEIQSSLIAHQFKNQGAPFVVGYGLHHMYMKLEQICYGLTEFQLNKATIAQLRRWYGISTWVYAGYIDARTKDEQALEEALLSVIMAKFSGANLIHDVGYVESGLTGSYEMIILTSELVVMTDQILQGIKVTEDPLMLDGIHEVSPGSQFMETEQTLSRFCDFWYPDLLDCGWLNTRVKEIIREHRPKPLDSSKQHKLKEILGQARRELIKD